MNLRNKIILPLFRGGGVGEGVGVKADQFCGFCGYFAQIRNRTAHSILQILKIESEPNPNDFRPQFWVGSCSINVVSNNNKIHFSVEKTLIHNDDLTYGQFLNILFNRNKKFLCVGKITFFGKDTISPAAKNQQKNRQNQQNQLPQQQQQQNQPLQRGDQQQQQRRWDHRRR